MAKFNLVSWLLFGLSLVAAFVLKPAFAANGGRAEMATDSGDENTPFHLTHPVSTKLFNTVNRRPGSAKTTVSEMPSNILKLTTPTITSGRIELVASDKTSFIEHLNHDAHFEFEQTTRADAFDDRRRILPNMAFDFVIKGDRFIPLQQSLQLSDHPHWNYIVGNGDYKVFEKAQETAVNSGLNVSNIGDLKVKAHITIPFHLVENNQNCVHNGLLTFSLSGQQVSDFYYQIGSETCLYYKANLWGKGKVKMTLQQAQTEKSTTGVYVKLPPQTLPIPTVYDDKLIAPFALKEVIPVTDMTLVGMLNKNKNLLSECQTRFGPYPYCDELVVPSYSTAKSLFAGLASLHLAKRFPEVLTAKVAEYVPACQSEKWQGVEFQHLLNMTSGLYQDVAELNDEAALHSLEFFAAKTHRQKINYACGHFDKRQAPGERFIYRTADTYILATALQNFIQTKLGTNAQLTTEVLWPIFSAMGLSETAFSTLQTQDKRAQPFGGFGLFFKVTDVVLLSRFVAKQMAATTFKSGLFHPVLLETLQAKNTAKKPQAKLHKPYLTGMPTQNPNIRYHNGFWLKNVGPLLGCKQQTWLPFMSGYGGITIVLIDPNRQYFYFSDSGVYDWRSAIQSIHHTQSVCQPTENI